MPVKVPYILNRLLRDRRDIVNLQDSMLSISINEIIISSTQLAIDGAGGVRALIAYTNNTQIFVNYTTTPGDGTQGIFVYNSASVAADDGVNVIIPSNNVSGTGAFVRAT